MTSPHEIGIIYKFIDFLETYKGWKVILAQKLREYVEEFESKECALDFDNDTASYASNLMKEE